MLTLDFRGKTAIVTGGLQGIGLAISDMFLRAGARVAIGDIGCAPGQRLRDANRLEIRADVTRTRDAQTLIDSTLDHFGAVDFVINNSGISVMSRIEHITEADWNRVMDVNAKGVYLVSQAAIAPMRRQGGGRIINIASQAGKNGYRLMGQYVASKHAVLGLTKVMAIELARDNILVNAVCPGIVETAMKRRERIEGAALRGMTADDILAEDCSQIPLGRTAQPQDVANVVAFLASPLSSYMTGQALNVTGGMTMH
ncbi:SDR family oxidoreductase [Brenneria izadpanahii]|uniref:SDR family oxidoreductase n=1 Tax=Brenneria izadpanahii TaxID=2722756 RepID=A0ABX7UMM6_9GAMM|nr:SDR family NAD(P)-dependent oxidoreductase [Brenneria izadpanahii]QTF06818.1 SDR family oxidoreductase [Brenneria izadpanahii]